MAGRILEWLPSSEQLECDPFIQESCDSTWPRISAESRKAPGLFRTSKPVIYRVKRGVGGAAAWTAYSGLFGVQALFTAETT